MVFRYEVEMCVVNKSKVHTVVANIVWGIFAENLATAPFSLTLFYNWPEPWSFSI